jgi:conjugal transfer ATP-binding protein TraC
MRGETTVQDSIFNNIKALLKEVFDAVKEQFEPTDAEKEKAFFDAVNSFPRLRNLLPYSGYMKDLGLFIIDDGANGQSFGFMLEFMPQTGANDDMEKVLQQVYRMGPTNTGIQVMMYGSPNIEHSLQRQQQMVASEDDIHHDLLRYRHAYLRKHTSQSLLEGGSYILRDMRAWIAVTVPVEDINTSVSQDKVVHFRNELKGVLESAHLKSWSWDPADLIDFLLDVTDHRRMFQGRNEAKASYDEGLFIRDHVRSGGMTDIKPNEFVNWWPDAENLRTRTIAMSAVKYPTEGFDLYQAGGMIGSFFDQVISYPCPFLITLGSWALNKDAAYKRALFKKERAKKLYEGQMGNLLPEIGQNYADWNNMIQALDAGYVSVRMYHQVLLFAPYDTAPQITTKVNSLWSSLGFTMLPDTFEMGQAFFSSMPMNLTEGMQEDLINHGRAGTKYSNNAIATSPVIGEWKGSGTPSILLHGRRGQQMDIDLYDNKQGNYNASIAGAPGSGKSVFMNELQRSFIAQGGRVWNFDSGYSYKKLNKVLRGQYIEFTLDSNININPFTHVKDIEDEMEALIFILGRMISPSNQLTDFHLAALDTSIQKVFAEYGTDTTPTQLWRYIKDKWRNSDGKRDDRVNDMAQMLEKWTENGSLGRWMNGPSNVQFDNDYVLLEMNELKNKSMLRDVVMSQMTLRISQEMFSNRTLRKMMLMDEAWDLMAGMTGSFMEDLARRVRKQDGSLVTGTQGLADYYEKSDASRAALMQSDWLFLLRQKEESLKTLEKDNRLSASEYELRMLRSLNTIRSEFRKTPLPNGDTYRGGYSEIFVKSPMGKGVGRLILDPYSLMLYSTLPADFNAMEEKMATGMDVSSAIKSVLADRGVSV